MTVFVCDMCGRQFNFKFEPIVHFKDHQNGLKVKTRNHIDKGYKCGVCEKEFSRKETYTNHYFWHTGKSRHKCVTCGKVFTRKVILENHKKTHSSETKVPNTKIIKATFSCGECPKIFTRKEYLKAHVSIHTKESQHKCLYCDKLFTQKQYLINHTRIHTGALEYVYNKSIEIFIRNFVENPFKCDMCSVQFASKKSLKAHIDGQCKIPSLKCHICSKSFTKESSVTNHINRSHCMCTDDSFKCEECGKNFVTKMNLIF